MPTSSYSQHENSAYVPTLWYQNIRHICSLVGMRVDQKVLFVNYAIVRSERRKENGKPTSSYSQHETSAYVPTLWYQNIRHICSLVGMRVDQKVLFVNYAIVRSERRKENGKKLNND